MPDREALMVLQRQANIKAHRGAVSAAAQPARTQACCANATWPLAESIAFRAGELILLDALAAAAPAAGIHR